MRNLNFDLLSAINYLLNFRFVKIYRPGSSEAEQLHGKE